MSYSGNILSTQDCSIMQITVAERLKVTGRDKHFVTWDHFSVILQGELCQLTRPNFIFLSDFFSLSLSLFVLFLLSPLGICVRGVESLSITAIEPLPLFSVEAFYFSMIANFIGIPSGKLCRGERTSSQRPPWEQKRVMGTQPTS